jgi:hypothetical protein
MKKMRLATLLVFAVCAFCLPAHAQKKWTYKADNGAKGFPQRSEVTIVITQRPNGYEVSGEWKYGEGQTCNIRGSYLPAGQRLRATCGDYGGKIEGFKIPGKDALQITLPFYAVAKRVGVKPETTGSPATTLVWEPAGNGDCAGKDEERSDGSSPKTQKVGSDGKTITLIKEGYTAVCWNGNNKNNPGEAFCTYKSKPPEECKGGRNPGAMYRAVRK